MLLDGRSIFSCFSSVCRQGTHFCEVQSQRCRSCHDYTEDCFTTRHIKNCSEYCFDKLKKNISETVKSIQNCSASDGFTLAEHHHLLIELFLFGIILILTVCLLYKFQRLPYFIRRILYTILNQEEAKGMVAVDGRLEVNLKQPLISDQKEHEANNYEEKLEEIHAHGKCGFNQHNQISNATKDDPSLCASGCRVGPVTT